AASDLRSQLGWMRVAVEGRRLTVRAAHAARRDRRAGWTVEAGLEDRPRVDRPGGRSPGTDVEPVVDVVRVGIPVGRGNRRSGSRQAGDALADRGRGSGGRGARNDERGRIV